LIKRGDLTAAVRSADALVRYALQERRLITWSAMHEVLWGGAFLNVRIAQMIDAATGVLPGADALLVDNEGRFSRNAPVDRHFRWLKEHGYNCIPSVKS
jgi:hypothetical protein